MLQVSVDEARRNAALKAPVKARVECAEFLLRRVQALKNLNMEIRDKQVTALIGPSGCGKSTFLRCFNRMHDLTPGSRYEGRIVLQPEDDRPGGTRRSIRSKCACASAWCFRSPIRFRNRSSRTSPMGCAFAACARSMRIQEEVEKALRGAALWDEAKDRLSNSALSLSGGQQQRLCIARALATSPEMLLFDEPTSALDPIATARIEELIASLREQVTVLIVTHNMQQAARVSDYTAFMYLGELIEFDETSQDLHQPGPEGHRRLHHRPLRLRRRPAARGSIGPQQLVDRGLGAGLRIDALDDDGAVEAVAAVLRRQRARHHHRARRHLP